MKKKKTLVSLIMVIVMIVSASVFVSAKTTEQKKLKHVLNYHDVDYDVNVVQRKSKKSDKLRLSSQVLPAYYTSEDENWFPEYVKKRNQGKYGTCWAFATSNAADISYAKEADKEKLSQVIRTSPGHFAYFFYHRSNDALSLTGKDRNTNTYSNWRNIGGNNIFSFQAMANRTGLAKESVAKYGKSEYARSIEKSLSYFTEDATIIQKPEGSNQMGAYNVVIKQEILNRGAVATSMYYDEKRYTVNNDCIYTNRTDQAINHAITIIGWDDNFKKEKFKTTARPAGNGAWICLNSWGESDAIFYISYYDKSVNPEVVSYDMEMYNKMNALYQYDGNASPYALDVNQNEFAANIFTAKQDLKLNKIGFTEYNEGENYDTSTKYAVSVYKNCTTGQPLSGEQIVDMEVTTTHPGYHTFSLGNSFSIDKGKKFSVVIKPIDDDAYIGVESASNEGWIKFVMGKAKNQSMYKAFSSDKWEDLYYAKKNSKKKVVRPACCFRIKAYAVNKEPQTIKISQGEIKINLTKAQENPEIVKPINAEVVWPESGHGEIIYKVTKGENVINVDSSTGEIDVLGPGEAIVSVTAVGTENLAKTTKTVTVKVGKDIRKEKVKGLKVKAGKKQITVSYSKLKDAKKYQISVATTKNGTKTVATVTGQKKTISKLKSKKIYYVKVRGVNDVYNGAWTIAKKIKVK